MADLSTAPTLDPRLRAALLPGVVARWARVMTAYFGTQAVSQLLGIAAGLLFVNFMPVREFALYTLASSVLTFFAFLSDLGSTGSLLYFFNRSLKSGQDFGRYISAVLSLRRSAFLVGSAVVLVAFPIAARSQGFSMADILPAGIAIMVGVWFQISASVRLLVLRLDDRYGASYRAELAGNGVRLVLALVLVAAALLRAWQVVLTAAAATAVTTFLAPQPGKYPRVATAAVAGERAQIIRYLLPTLPSALYFSVQGPLAVWLAAAFGQTRNLAEVGALGRLGLVVGLFSGLSGIVFLPRLARIADEGIFLRRYWQFGGILVIVVSSLLAGAVLWPNVALALIGSHYSGMNRELGLVVLAAGLALLDGYAVSVNNARSWTRWQSTALAALIAIQVCLIATMRLDTTVAILEFRVFSTAIGLGSQLVIAAVGFKRPAFVKWEV